MRPVGHDLVGVGEPGRGREHRPGVAHRHPVAEELADPGHGGGEVDRAEDQHPRRRRERLDEHRQLVQPSRSPSAPYRRTPVRPCASMPRASSSTAWSSRSPEPSVPAAAPGLAEPGRRARSPGGRRPGRARRSPSPPRPARPARPPRRHRPARVALPADRLDEDVDDAAAGQAHREGVIVADAVGCSTGCPSGRPRWPARRRRPRRSRPTRCPTTSPSADTASAAPGSRGALLNVRTTVARPNVSPASHHLTIGSRMSRNRLHLGTLVLAVTALQRR